MSSESTRFVDTPFEASHNAAENYASDDRDLITLLCESLAILWKDWPKQMELTELEVQSGKFSLRGECPHCRRWSVFIQVTGVHATELTSEYQRLAVGMQCQGCLDYILALAMKTRKPVTTLSYLKHYPLGQPQDSVDPNVPKDIAADFAEALRCQFVGSYKAAVAMCRRSVEAACKHLGAKGKNLFEKIESLAAMDIITDPMRRMAHQVRLTGNRKLHDKAKTKKETDDSGFEADDLDLMKEKDANAMITFTKEFFHHVYAIQALLKEYEKPEGETPADAS